jgi:hypothetical protein
MQQVSMSKPFFEAEIAYEDEVPLAPNVSPVILLKGSDYDMGYQYARQLHQIFGPWPLERMQRDFTGVEVDTLQVFQEYLEKYTPEFIDMFRGMVFGAADLGLKISFQEILAENSIAAGAFPPGRSIEPASSQTDKNSSSDCSGFAAWGKATKDGKLICGATSDHEVRPELTIIILPETGNNHILRMSLPGTPSVHPAMNNKGLAFVHHCSGTSDGNEKPGCGIPVRLSTQHTLRFARNADEALALQLAYPSGIRTAGLWADIGGRAFALECREPRVVRKAGDHDERDFLYVTNNSIAREMGTFLQNRFKWPLLYIPHGGWNVDDMNSVRRNLCMWNALHNYYGQVDLDFVKMLLRFPSQPPGYPALEEADIKLFTTQGMGWDTHIANLGNAIVGILQPDNGNKGLYYACVGPAYRQAEPLTAGYHYYQVAATHTFFEVQLASSPDDISNATKKRAQYDLYYANRELRKLNYRDIPYVPLDAIFNRSATEMQKGDYYLALAQKTKGNESVCHYGKAVRAFTRCQVYAKQVYESLVPPPSKPTDLGLGEWFGSWGPWESYPPR